MNAAWELFRDSAWSEPEVVRYAAAIWVWLRWLVAAVCLFLLVYRPSYFSTATHTAFFVLLVLLVACNACQHFMVLSGRAITWPWMLALKALDVVLVTAAVLATSGFSHYALYLLYYPSLAMFAVVFTSFRLNLVWVTVLASIYTAVCLLVGDGIDLEAGDDKTFLIRIVVMYVVVVVNRVSSFERVGRRESLERERVLQRERIEVSQTIHDTTAQNAYMIGLGIDTAIELAGDSNQELRASLAATSALSKATMWELRRPIDGGLIFEGRSLARVLRAHASTFTKITSVPALAVQSGTEPPLSEDTKSRLFSIAHNALTNAFLHARADGVEVGLDFAGGGVRLWVSDDGVGLPENYRDLGRGFSGMAAAAEMVGGVLQVGPGPGGSGTAVCCVIPPAWVEGGD